MSEAKSRCTTASFDPYKDGFVCLGAAPTVDRHRPDSNGYDVTDAASTAQLNTDRDSGFVSERSSTASIELKLDTESVFDDDVCISDELRKLDQTSSMTSDVREESLTGRDLTRCTSLEQRNCFIQVGTDNFSVFTKTV